MAQNKEVIGVLNDLIQINNDRTAGYTRAAEDTKNVDVDLRTIFERLADDSRQNAIELTSQVGRLGGEPATGTTASGKIYRAWMNVKDMFTGKDRHAVLENCEFGEDAAQKAYDTAMESDAEMSPEIRQIIAEQQAVLNRGHDLIKEYRDAHEAVS